MTAENLEPSQWQRQAGQCVGLVAEHPKALWNACMQICTHTHMHAHWLQLKGEAELKPDYSEEDAEAQTSGLVSLGLWAVGLGVAWLALTFTPPGQWLMGQVQAVGAALAEKVRAAFSFQGRPHVMWENSTALAERVKTAAATWQGRGG